MNEVAVARSIPEGRPIFAAFATEAGFKMISDRGMVIWSHADGRWIRPAYINVRSGYAVLAQPLDQHGSPVGSAVNLAEL